MNKVYYKKIGIIGLLAIILLIFIGRVQILRSIGTFLVVENPLQKADVIVVLGGEEDRVDESVRLYQRGWAQYILISGGPPNNHRSTAQIMGQRAMDLGVPGDHIILETDSMSTYQHPILIKPILKERGFHSAIIVSSPYHMRRAAMLFNRHFKGSGIQFIFHPVAQSWFDSENWWTNPWARRIVRDEYLKLSVNIWGRKVNDFFWYLKSNNGTCRHVH